MATVTISVNSPAVVTWTAHGFSAGQAVWFGFQWPLGYLPSGTTPGILYYVLAASLTSNSFRIAATPGGTPINTTGIQFGTITGTATSSALNNFVPPVDPSPGTKTKPVLKLKAADFGDGYTQVTRDGLNWIRQVATLQWDLLLPAQAGVIEQFFIGQGGDTPFYYALRDDVIRKWTCKDWERDRNNVGKISATFREDFSLLA
jgi:phage-related protein